MKRLLIDGYVVALGVLTFSLARGAETLTRLAWAWVVGTTAAVAAAITGLVLFAAGRRTPDENFAIGDLGSVPDGAYPRLIGLFLNPNMACSYLVVGLLFGAATLGWHRWSGRVYLAATAATLAFTYSPGLGGAFVAGAMWLAVSARARLSPRWRTAVVTIGAVGAAGFLVFAATLGPRAGTWTDAVGTIADDPVLGVGPGEPVSATNYRGRFFTDAHNAWLNVGGQAGLVGLVALGGVALAVTRSAWRARPLAHLPEPLLAGCCALAGAVLFHSLSMSLEQMRHVWILTGFVAGGLASHQVPPLTSRGAA
jgi:O-antigen ligase